MLASECDHSVNIPYSFFPGGPLRESRECLEGSLWPFLALSGFLGLRLGPWRPLVGITCWGKAIAFSCLARAKIGFVLTELCSVVG